MRTVARETSEKVDLSPWPCPFARAEAEPIARFAARECERRAPAGQRRIADRGQTPNISRTQAGRRATRRATGRSCDAGPGAPRLDRPGVAGRRVLGERHGPAFTGGKARNLLRRHGERRARYRRGAGFANGGSRTASMPCPPPAATDHSRTSTRRQTCCRRNEAPFQRTRPHAKLAVQDDLRPGRRDAAAPRRCDARRADEGTSLRPAETPQPRPTAARRAGERAALRRSLPGIAPAFPGWRSPARPSRRSSAPRSTRRRRRPDTAPASGRSASFRQRPIPLRRHGTPNIAVPQSSQRPPALASGLPYAHSPEARVFTNDVNVKENS